MKKIWHYKWFLFFVLISFTLSAQESDSWKQTPRVSGLMFMDVFYTYDFNQPQSITRQPFLFNHNRHNEFNLNLGLIKLTIENPKYRANFALQTGTYANDNYAAEPGVLKNIFEANVGVSLNKSNSLWLDAGILPSHIGFENAISMDNLTLTRSLLAENSPYFLTGAKITYDSPNKKWTIAGLIVNGWQRIQRLEGNSLPSFGTQLTFTPNKNTTLNWSTFIGTDDPDITRRMRFFNNVYGQFQFSENFQIITGFDIGVQQQSKSSAKYDTWFSPVIIGQLTHNEKWKSVLRVEYYQDKTGIIIPINTPNGFKTFGYSYNLDYVPSSMLVCRLEARWLNSEDVAFQGNNGFKENTFFVSASMAIKLSEILNK